MSTTSFKMRASEAARAEARAIETGAAICTIKHGYLKRSTKGTLGVVLSVETDTGARSDYVHLWIENADGVELAGRRKLDALMCCLRQRELATALARVKTKVDGREVEEEVEGLPGLTNAKVGIVFQVELSIGDDGRERRSPVPYAFFEASSRMTAKEILAKATKATAIDAMLATLTDYDRRGDGRGPAQRARAQQGQRQGRATGGGFADMEDDIPF